MRDVFPLPSQLLSALEPICARAEVYRNSRLCPPPLLLWAEEGDALRTGLLEGIAQRYGDAGLIQAPGYIQSIRLDGSWESLFAAHQALLDASPYTDDFPFLVGVQLDTGLCIRQELPSGQAGLAFLRELTQRTAVILFAPSGQGGASRVLARALPGLLELRLDPCSHRELLEMACAHIRRQGVRLAEEGAFRQRLLELLKGGEITSPQAMLLLLDIVLQKAAVVQGSVQVDAAALETVFPTGGGGRKVHDP